MRDSILLRLLLVGSLLLTIAVLSFLGGSLLQKQAKNRIAAYEKECRLTIDSLQMPISSEEWWRGALRETLLRAAAEPDGHQLADSMQKISRAGSDSLQLMIWKRDGEVLHAVPTDAAARFNLPAAARALTAIISADYQPVLLAEASEDLDALYAMFEWPVLHQLLIGSEGGEAHFIRPKPGLKSDLFWLQVQGDTFMWARLPEKLFSKPVHAIEAIKVAETRLAADQILFLFRHETGRPLEILQQAGKNGFSNPQPDIARLLSEKQNSAGRWQIVCENLSGGYILVAGKRRSFMVMLACRPEFPLLLLWLLLMLATPLLVKIWRSWGSFRVSMRLCLLFIIANLMPMTIALAGFGDYLWQKNLVGEEEVRQRTFSAMRSLDEGYLSFRFGLESRLGYLTDELQKLIESGEKPQKICEWLKLGLAEFPYSNFTLLQNGSKVLFTERGEVGKERSKMTSNDELTVALMQFIFYKTSRIAKPDLRMEMLDSFVAAINNKPADEVVLDFVRFDRRFRDFGFGRTILPTYIAFIKDSGRQEYSHALIVSFRSQNLQHAFISGRLAEINRNSDCIRFAAIDDQSFCIGGFGGSMSDEQKRFVRSLGLVPAVFAGEVTEGDSVCELSGIRGYNLNLYSLLAFRSVQSVGNKLNVDRLGLIISAGLDLIFMTLVIIVLRRRFAGPLSELKAGILALAARDFSWRVPVRGNDELGQAAAAFNDIMVDSHDLQLAGQVQQKLFPERIFRHGRLMIASHNSSMGELGGDYFDCLRIDEHRAAFLIGDVTGHGVPAAMIMAMAKAVTVQNQHLWTRPKELLEELHHVLRAVRRPDAPMNMTFQYFLVDTLSGEVQIANAGHPFPFLISQNGGCEKIQITSVPLGSIARPMVNLKSVFIRPGEKLVAWTDGLAEMAGPDGRVFGYDNLPELVQSCDDNDLPQMLEKLMKKAADFRGAAARNDDITLIIAAMEGGQDS